MISPQNARIDIHMADINFYLQRISHLTTEASLREEYIGFENIVRYHIVAIPSKYMEATAPVGIRPAFYVLHPITPSVSNGGCPLNDRLFGL